MVICLEQDADLHTAKLMPLPLTVSCFSKIQIGFTFLVLAHPGSPGKKGLLNKCARVCSCIYQSAVLSKKMWPIVMDVPWSVHLLVTTVSPTKATELIEVQFVVWTLVRPRNHVLLGAGSPGKKDNLWGHLLAHCKL